MIFLFIDIFMYNFTPYPSYFFLINLSDKDFLTNFCMALIIDLFLMHTFFLNTLIISLLYLIKKYGLHLNLNNFLTYVFYNLSNLEIYYLLLNLIFHKSLFNNFLLVFVINLIFIIISYKNKSNDIKFIG